MLDGPAKPKHHIPWHSHCYVQLYRPIPLAVPMPVRSPLSESPVDEQVSQATPQPSSAVLSDSSAITINATSHDGRIPLCSAILDMLL